MPNLKVNEIWTELPLLNSELLNILCTNLKKVDLSNAGSIKVLWYFGFQLSMLSHKFSSLRVNTIFFVSSSFLILCAKTENNGQLVKHPQRRAC